MRTPAAAAGRRAAGRRAGACRAAGHAPAAAARRPPRRRLPRRGNRLRFDGEDDEVSVVCGKVGFLTGCDDCGEFHFSCVGLYWPPDGEAWSCPDCNPPAWYFPPAPLRRSLPETFECAICYEQQPLEMETGRIAAGPGRCGCEISISICSHCAFKAVDLSSQCAGCRADLRQLEQISTTRFHEVAERQRGANEIPTGGGDSIEDLVEMGFEPENAQVTLEAADGDVDRAAAILLEDTSEDGGSEQRRRRGGRRRRRREDDSGSGSDGEWKGKKPLEMPSTMQPRRSGRLSGAAASGANDALLRPTTQTSSRDAVARRQRAARGRGRGRGGGRGGGSATSTPAPAAVAPPTPTTTAGGRTTGGSRRAPACAMRRRPPPRHGRPSTLSLRRLRSPLRPHGRWRTCWKSTAFRLRTVPADQESAAFVAYDEDLGLLLARLRIPRHEHDREC